MQLISKNLTVQRNKQFLFKNLTFSFQKGEIVNLSGANGTGKSTLLRIIAGLYPFFTGNLFLQIGPRKISPHTYCHYLGLEHAMKENLTVEQNLSFWQAYYKTPSRRYSSIIAKTKIKKFEKMPFSFLSAGQKKRVAFTRLLLKNKPIWLLDEPTLTLDQEAQKILYEMIEEIKDHILLIVASHIPFMVGEKNIHLPLKTTRNLSSSNHSEEYAL